VALEAQEANLGIRGAFQFWQAITNTSALFSTYWNGVDFLYIAHRSKPDSNNKFPDIKMSRFQPSNEEVWQSMVISCLPVLADAWPYSLRSPSGPGLISSETGWLRDSHPVQASYLRYISIRGREETREISTELNPPWQMCETSRMHCPLGMLCEH